MDLSDMIIELSKNMENRIKLKVTNSKVRQECGFYKNLEKFNWVEGILTPELEKV